MKRTLLGLLIVALTGAGLAGCSEKATMEKKTTVTTPGGQTTTTTTQTVEKSGDNPPPARP